MTDNRKAMCNKPFFRIYLRTSQNNGSMSPHFHFYHQILLITEGMAKFYIGDKQYIAQAGSFLIISAFKRHSFEVLTYPYNYNGYVLAINNEFASAFLHHPLAFSVFLQHPNNFCHIANLDCSIMLKAQNICIEMEKELIKKR
ncbi:cupin domain-containing protein [Thermoanaerobacterium thermosaccharolyticum]|uniref:cupin domain-containing protein n=1 Tax=Thermoanaerobacterium thermosaccharolyticum TaxID=1517 RepID=UPI003DA83A5D